MIVNLATKDSRHKPLCGVVRGSAIGPTSLVWLGLIALFCLLPSRSFAMTQSQPLPGVPAAHSGPPDASGTPASAGEQQTNPQADPQSPGSISGTILDSMGAAVAGARVKLTREDQSPSQEVISGDDGQFSFAGVPPGPFQLTITSEGFATQVSSGILHPGEICFVPQIVLAIATAITEVRVGLSPVEIAEEQIKAEEKQRVLGVIPNFYVSYVPNAVPLTSKQKFKLAWRTTIDPVTFGLTGAIAGVQQANNDFSGYGQGAQGYAKRYGANYANLVTGTFIGSAILPSLLKQDPRYFYKGTGTVRARFFYAVANSVICKGDNGHWQPNYSSILGSLASGGISNAYYPAQNRDGAELTFENALIGIGTTATGHVIQEFLIPKITPNLPNHQSGKP